MLFLTIPQVHAVVVAFVASCADMSAISLPFALRLDFDNDCQSTCIAHLTCPFFFYTQGNA